MIRRLAKSAALGILRSAGGFSIAANSSGRRNSLLILCYHGLSLRDEHEWCGPFYMTPGLFRSRLEALRSAGANVLPLAEAVDRLRGGSLPSRSVVITFDDGFCDFLLCALPLLNEFSFPATLYLTTHYSNYRVPVFNVMANYLLWKSGKAQFEWPEIGIARMRIRTEEERWTVVKEMLQWSESQQLDTLGKDELASRLAAKLEIGYDDLLRARLFQNLTIEEATQVARAGIDIQLHTHRHRMPRSKDLFMREIMDNRDRIREITGSDPRHFCYPSGDYEQLFLPWLREMGIASATTCELGSATASSEPLLLPRLLDGEQLSAIEFDSWLYGVRR
jgi:peptidoglycan/xylan/chitin deacetylase (PgdA/CDA1 family)